MKSLKYVWFGLALLAVILVIPMLMEAKDRVITVNSLEKAYSSRMAAIDAELPVLQAQLETEQANLRASCLGQRKAAGRLKEVLCYELGSDLSTELSQKITSLKEEQRTLPFTYNLLVEALQ